MADLAITERGFVPLWQVTAWPGTVAKVAARIAAATEAEAPAPGMISGGAARIGPLVWWLTGEAVEVAASLAEMPAEEGTLLDLGGGRVAFRVEGAHARDLLCRLAPIDFREASFPEGRIVSTVAHLMSVQIARTGEGYDIYVSSSFAGTLRDLLNETAMQWQPAA